MPNRMISLERNTNETQIDLTLDLDGTGRYEVDTGCGFLNHMLELFARHGRFDLVLTCHGDVQVDYHHTTEDVGIALGQAFARALGDMRGIQRYGSFYLPMDEALILCAVDLSGRCTLNWDVHCSTEKVGDFDVECAKEFWLGFARSVDPIMPQEVTITRVAITTEADAEKKGTEMGRKYIVPYGLYRCEGYVSANLARKTTGFSEEDLSLLWEAILNMFENDHSAARGKMAVRELIVFKHDSELGCAPAWKPWTPASRPCLRRSFGAERTNSPAPSGPRRQRPGGSTPESRSRPPRPHKEGAAHGVHRPPQMPGTLRRWRQTEPVLRHPAEHHRRLYRHGGGQGNLLHHQRAGAPLHGPERRWPGPGAGQGLLGHRLQPKGSPER